MVDSPPSQHQVNENDIDVLRSMGLLRSELSFEEAEGDPYNFGIIYNGGVNLAVEEYETRKALQQRCRDFACACGFSLRVQCNSWNAKKQEGNAKYICKQLKGQQQLQAGANPVCSFFINVYGKNDKWKITKMCISHEHIRHAGFHAQTFEEGNLGNDNSQLRQRDMPFIDMQGLIRRDMLPVYGDKWSGVAGKAIVDFMRRHGIEISRPTASKLKHAVLDAVQGDIIESYQKLESYMMGIANANEGSHYDFEKTEDGRFKRACFFPSACLQARLHCKNVVGLEGTHLKGDMNKRGIFLVATSKDVNDHIVVFGLALVPVEDYSNWLWFLENMKIAVEHYCSDFQPAFISDRQKGLLSAVHSVFEGCGHRFCLRHIIGNISKLGSVLAPREKALVYAMARSECENDNKFYHNLLALSRPKATSYLEKIDKEHWVTYAFSEKFNKPTYGEVTSNLCESANNWIGNTTRSSMPLNAFEMYFMKIVELFASRRAEAARRDSRRQTSVSANYRDGSSATIGTTTAGDTRSQLTNLTFKYQKLLDSMIEFNDTCEILPCLDGIYMVRFTEPSSRPNYTHQWRSVNLVEHGCTCTVWQDIDFPCIHAVKAAIHHGKHISELFGVAACSKDAFASTFNYQFVPVVCSSVMKEDLTLTIPAVIKEQEEVGKWGKKPGPKPKHKRKNAKVGSLTAPTIATTQ